MQHLTINLLPEGVPEPPIYFYTACSRYPQHTMRYADDSQDFYQILFVLSGSGILHCCEKTYPLQQGCAFFTAKGCPSEYRDTGGLTTAFLTVRGSAVPVLLAHYHCDTFLFAEHVDLEKYLSGIDRIIREYYEHKREGHLSALVYSFYVDFFEDQTGVPISVTEKTASFLEKNFTKKLTLEQLATINGISVSKLCHDFKKAFGCTVFDYILHLRLTYARSHLKTSREVRTKDAALACGFEDISYFCRAYKKKFGKSPSRDQAEFFS